MTRKLFGLRIWLVLALTATAQVHADVTDYFNRSNGGLGSNWTVAASGSAPPQIVGNAVTIAYDEFGGAMYTGTSFSGAQFSELRVVSGLTGTVLNLRVRARQYTTSGTSDAYVGQLGSSGWRIIRLDNQVETELASGAFPSGYANGDVFYFEANGSTLTLKQNGATLGSTSDSTYTAGDPGFGMWNPGTLTLDDWRAGSIGSGDVEAPTTPSNPVANSVSTFQMNVSWSASTDFVGVTGYLLERCQGSGCSNFAQIATPSGTSLSDTGLTPSTSYSYRVRATDAANNISGYSSVASATTQSAPSEAYDNFNRSNGGLGSNWTAAYGGSAAPQISSNQATIGYDDYAATYYTGTSFGGAQFAELKIVSGQVDTVLNLKIRTRQYTTSETADGYTGQIGSTGGWRILRLDNGVETELLAGAFPNGYSNGDNYYFEANGSTLTLKQNSVTLGTTTDSTYTTGDTGFGLWNPGALILDDWHTGELSNDITAPTAPSGLSVIAISASQINLTWTASTDAVGVTGYVVERCEGASCTTFSPIATPTGTSYSDTGRTASTSYSYRVRALDAANNLSSYSSTSSATTSAGGGSTGPNAPTGLTLTLGLTQINLSWTASSTSGVTHYVVERCAGPACTTFTAVGTATGTTYADVAVLPGLEYTYRVKAADAAEIAGDASAGATDLLEACE